MRKFATRRRKRRRNARMRVDQAKPRVGKRH